MTLSRVLNSALSGLGTAQQALAVTANNITNANTESYVRKVHVQSTNVLAGQAMGVRAEDPTRVADEFLTLELRGHTSRLGRSSVVQETHERLQNLLFGAPGQSNRGISGRIADLATAVETSANSPDKPSLRTQVADAASELARAIKSGAETVQGLRLQADEQIARTVQLINDDLEALHAINVELARGTSSTELFDARDAVLSRLAQKIEFSTYQQDDNRIAVYARGGQALLEGTPRVLHYDPAPTTSPETIFAPIAIYTSGEVDPTTRRPLPGSTGLPLVTGGLRAELPPELATGTSADAALEVRTRLTAGALKGMLDVRDRVLPELADQLAELGRLTRFAINAAHNDAVSLPPPAELRGTRPEDGSFDAATRSGTAYLAVVDRASGNTLRTIAIDVTQSRDALIAQLDADLAGYGTAALDADNYLDVRLGSAFGIALSEGSSRIVTSDPVGHDWTYGFSHFFGLNDLFTVEGSNPTALAVRADIAADPTRIAGAKLDVDTGPPVVASLGGAGDGRGLQRLAEAFSARYTPVQRGKLPAASTTLGGYASDIVAVAAVNGEQARLTLEKDEALVSELATQNAGVSGVNVDEELSKLVLYQQSYAVSARLISITAEMFDDLMNIKR